MLFTTLYSWTCQTKNVNICFFDKKSSWKTCQRWKLASVATSQRHSNTRARGPPRGMSSAELDHDCQGCGQQHSPETGCASTHSRAHPAVDDERRFACSTCTRQHMTAREAYFHARYHTTGVQNRSSDAIPAARAVYICTLCDRRFQNAQGASNHTRMKTPGHICVVLEEGDSVQRPHDADAPSAAGARCTSPAAPQPASADRLDSSAPPSPALASPAQARPLQGQVHMYVGMCTCLYINYKFLYNKI
jgi:hypothetical protein